MSSDSNTIGMRTGRVIDSVVSTVDEGIEDTGDLVVSGVTSGYRRSKSLLGRAVEYVEDLWNNHATKIVLLILLLFAVIFYRQEVSQATYDVTDAVTGAVTGAVDVVGDAVVGDGLSDTTPVATGAPSGTLAPIVQPGELSDISTPAELAALFAA